VGALFLVSSGIIIIIPMTDAAFAATIRGNNRDNVLKETDRRDTIHGRGGHDTIYGYRGNDVLYGGRGDDRIWGGAHDDKIYAWHGSNVVTGGRGNDRIWATGSGEGDDIDYNILRGHDGNDRFIVRNSGFTIKGGPGNDNIDAAGDLGGGGPGGTYIYADAGNDYVRSADIVNGGVVEIDGGPGRDRLIATGEVSFDIFGLDGDDWLHISTFDESFAYGGAGNDYVLSTFIGELYGHEGDDVLESRGDLATNQMRGERTWIQDCL
jgi:Ca2+-binding RTX toxin-like protein